MKFIGLDNRVYTLSVSEYIVYDNNTRKKSELHLRARKLIAQLYPCTTILEEVPLSGCKSERTLLADFLIPSQKILVEVNGEQHYKYIKHFHGSVEGFKTSLKRDAKKREWCELNSITLIELPFGETDEQWSKRFSV